MSGTEYLKCPHLRKRYVLPESRLKKVVRYIIRDFLPLPSTILAFAYYVHGFNDVNWNLTEIAFLTLYFLIIAVSGTWKYWPEIR